MSLMGVFCRELLNNCASGETSRSEDSSKKQQKHAELRAGEHVSRFGRRKRLSPSQAQRPTFGTGIRSGKTPDQASEGGDEDERNYPFPRVTQSKNDSQVEVAQVVYGRLAGNASVRFIVSDIVGKGHYGMVFLAQEELTQRVFAVKVMKKEVRNIHKYAHIEEAVLRMSRACPFIIQLFSSFQTTNSFYLVMEYAEGGNLKQIIDEYGCLTIQSARFLTAEMTLALAFLHSNGVIHRDLKIQNILMTDDRHLRLIDFGLSRMDIFDGDTTNSGCGTPFYMAPEILRRTPYSHEVDWWALGVVLYKLITGTFPFMGKTNPEVFVAVTRDSVYYDPALPADLVSLLKGLLRKNPAKRLGYGVEGWKHVQEHPFYCKIDWVLLKEQKLNAPPYDHTPEESHAGTDNPACATLYGSETASVPGSTGTTNTAAPMENLQMGLDPATSPSQAGHTLVDQQQS